MKFYDVDLRPATNADIPRLPALLGDVTRCHLVRVRNNWFIDENRLGFELLSLVKGPFRVLDEDGFFVMYGFDRVTGEPGKARVDGDVFQYVNLTFTEWGMSPSWIQLFVPEVG